MSRDTASAISAVLGAVQERWGSHSLTRGYNGPRASGMLALRARHTAQPALPPWWPGAEGYLRPNLLELRGPDSCGKLGVALLWLAAASRGGLVAVVDQAGTFYPPAAAASGLDLARLVVVRPPDRREAVEAVSLLLASAGFDAVLWPLEWKTRPRGLDSVRLSTLAARSKTTLLALVTDRRRASGSRLAEHADSDADRLFPSADVRLRVTAWEWRWQDGELAGVSPRLRTERLRGAQPGQEWELRLEQHRAVDASGMGPDGLREGAFWTPGREASTREAVRGGIAAAAGRTERVGGSAPGPHMPGPHARHAGQQPSGRAGACPPADHLCLAAALPLGGGGARATGPAGAADLGVRSEPAASPAARTA
ncbi:MAG: hypothetical protein IT306_03045 [Chloroflexi bacterium]|nr:hypothetical protein [Chloroflexota bacterium]